MPTMIAIRAAATFALAIACGAPASAEPAPRYRVTMTIIADNQAVGSPEIVVEEGRLAEVSVTGRYVVMVRVRAVPRRPRTVALETDIRLPTAGGMAPSASPELELTLDSPASMDIDDRYGERLRVQAMVSRSPQ